MTQAKALLSRARRADRQLQAVLDRQRRCEGIERAAGGAGPRLAALQEDLKSRAERWAAEQLAVAAAIDRLDDPVQREVLQHRYLDGLDWREIAERMGYSREWLWRVHRQAVGRLEGMIGEGVGNRE